MKGKTIISLVMSLILIVTLFQPSVLAASLPSRPTITYPSEGGIVKQGSLTIRWDSASGAKFYKLAVKDLDENNKFMDDVNIGRVTSYTISSSKIKAGHSYRIALGAVNTDGEAWSECSFRVEEDEEPQPPERPTITSPANGDTIEQGSVTIRWNSATGVSYYKLAVKDLDDNNKFMDDVNIGRVTSYTISSSKIKAGHRYQIALAAVNSDGEAWRESFFTVKEVAPEPRTIEQPIFKSPTEGAILDAGSLRVSWEEVEGAEGYIFSLRDDTLDEIVIQNTNVGLDTYYTIPSRYIIEGHSYRCAVRVENDKEKKWTLRSFSIEAPIEDTPHPISYTEVKYLPLDDKVYVRADIHTQVVDLNNIRNQKVWAGIYDLDNQTWLYKVRDVNNEMSYIRNNSYEIYIDANKLPRDRRIGFIIFIKDYYTYENMIGINIPEDHTIKITPIPPNAWNVRYNWETDELEAYAKPYSELSSDTDFYLVVYENETPLYPFHKQYEELTNIPLDRDTGKYFQSWKLSSQLYLARGKTYKCAVIARGYEDYFSDELMKSITINKVSFTNEVDKRITYNKANQLIEVNLYTQGIPKRFKVQLYNKEKGKYIDLTRKKSSDYDSNAYYHASFSAIADLGLNYDKTYEFSFRVLDNNENVTPDNSSISIRVERPTQISTIRVSAPTVNPSKFDVNTAWQSAEMCYYSYLDKVKDAKHYKKGFEQFGFTNVEQYLFDKPSILHLNSENSLQATVGIKSIENNRKLIVIAFRGTEFNTGIHDLLLDFRCAWKVFRGNIRVHAGFNAAAEAFQRLEPKVRIDGHTLEYILNPKNKIRDNYMIWITGHSLGGAIGTLYGAKLLDRGVSTSNLFVYTFGAPAAGDREFEKVYTGKLNIYPVVNQNDPVPFSTFIADNVIDIMKVTNPIFFANGIYDILNINMAYIGNTLFFPDNKNKDLTFDQHGKDIYISNIKALMENKLDKLNYPSTLTQESKYDTIISELRKY